MVKGIGVSSGIAISKIFLVKESKKPQKAVITNVDVALKTFENALGVSNMI